MTRDEPQVPIYVSRLQTPTRAECRAFSQVGKSIGWTESRLGADEFGAAVQFDWERTDEGDESPRWRLQGNLYAVIDEVILEDPVALRSRHQAAFDPDP